MNSKLKITGIAFTTFATGALIGSAGSSGGAPPAAQAPTVTVTQAAPPQKAETKTVTKEVTPAACTLALQNADKTLELSSRGFLIVGKAFEAAQNADIDALIEANGDLAGLEPELADAANSYRAAAKNCRAASSGNI